MKSFLLLAVLLVVAGCGTAAGEPVAGRGSEPAPTVVRPPVATSTRPPDAYLGSAAGRQVAVLGSYCVDAQLEGGCADSGPVHPQQVTVSRPGDEVTFALDNAQIVRAGGCVADTAQACIGTVTVLPLGCDRKAVTTIPLVRDGETHWAVGLEAGSYQLDLFAHFKTDDGRTGDLSGTFGLLVQLSGAPKLEPVAQASALCPFPG